MWELLYEIIFQILQQLAYVHELCIELKVRALALFFWSYDLCCSSAAREQQILEQCKSQLSKYPRHLCVILSPESKQVNGAVLRRILTYALVMGVECVTVYDRRKVRDGYVDLHKLQPPEHVESVERHARGILWRENDRFSGKRGGLTKNKNGFRANGHKSKELLIHAVNISDGHALISQVCRELHEKRDTATVQNLLDDRTSLTDYISQTLERRLEVSGLAEPELGIVFGRFTCTYGFLPWHIRFTEFHTLSSACHFNAQTFADVLYKYARCEQRWGK